ncbi:juvenile hormone esterase isoform X1 [Maniola hyperantus]|uniref:juvenile hormone esterase isoform X1 n=2 Tax=Aphantopus hyperantus TaxID=2795564 RepID=UPI0015683D8F|nr:esterase E4 [Maniola hyperantus]
MCRRVALWLLNGVLVFVCASENVPLRNTPLGELKGFFMKTRGGRQISAFTAVPYASPPVGDLRFKAPVPVSPWEGTWDATNVSPICVQRNPYTRQDEIVGQEDCLYLNVYTPFTNNEPIAEKDLLPVMVFIHGGGWMCGDATTEMYGPEHLLDRDVVYVAMNYRLGPLGFLSTQDEHCPGNNGLKDQQEALRFIQKNIYAFGGNNQSVTIFGESAGGASVNFHMLSDTSTGLFHKAISESGTALVPWAEAPPGEARRNAFRLAKFLDCPPSPSERLIECLRNLDSYEIIGTEFLFYSWDYEPMTTFKAVVEPDLPGAFLTRNPRKPPSSAFVPWLTGLTKDEGCLKSVWLTNFPKRYEEFISGFDTIAPVTFYYENSPYPDAITGRLKKEYFGTDDEQSVKDGILKMYTDSYFAYPMLESVEQALNFSSQPVYLYHLVYRGANSFSQIFGDSVGDYGVCHADDLMYLFPIHFLNKPFTEEDNKMMDLMITLWTNFATSGDPNKPVQLAFDWKPATSGKNMEYLEIGKQQAMKNDLASRSRLWADLPLWHNVRRRRITDEL